MGYINQQVLVQDLEGILDHSWWREIFSADPNPKVEQNASDYIAAYI